jgi:hypothetical protein
MAFYQSMRHASMISIQPHFPRKGIFKMSNTNVEQMYQTKMSSSSRSNPEGNKIIEQRHTRSEIISHAEELLAKELGQDLATYAKLEQVGTRGNVGEDTVYGYVDPVGKKVDFTDDMKFKAAIAVLNLNGHFFEATPVN